MFRRKRAPRNRSLHSQLNCYRQKRINKYIIVIPKTAKRLVCRNSIDNVLDTTNCISPIPSRAPATICEPNEQDTNACNVKRSRSINCKCRSTTLIFVDLIKLLGNTQENNEMCIAWVTTASYLCASMPTQHCVAFVFIVYFSNSNYNIMLYYQTVHMTFSVIG